MKATIKATGEIVEIKDLYDDGTALVGNMYIKVSELNFFSENIDWEQRRYELVELLIGLGYTVALIKSYRDSVMRIHRTYSIQW